MSKSTNDKSTLADDTSAFKRTLVWCSVAAAIHIVIIGGVSGGQWMFKADDKAVASANAAPKATANAAANATNAPAANAANAANAARNATTPPNNEAANSRMMQTLNETLPPPKEGPGSGGVKLDFE